MWRASLPRGRLRTLFQTKVVRHASSSQPTGLSSRRMAGIAVGCLAAVSAGAIYDLTSRWVGRQDDEEWLEDWEEELADEAGVPPEIAASFVVARELRQASDPLVGTRHLIFVRHGQPSDGVEQLSEIGLQQAELTAVRLATQIKDVKYKELLPCCSAHATPSSKSSCCVRGGWQVIFHSSAEEAKATAKIIKKSLGKVALKESPLLAEGVPLVPSPAPEVLRELPAEALVGDMSRAEGALRTHLWRPAGGPESSAEVIVAHGNVIRYVICRALQLNPSAWSRFAAGHATISWLEIQSDGLVKLREFGGSGHLPLDIRTYT
ncbi:unnamed protein product [Cladocopium goreaui]|uniref:Serine/threonine-protein phosphatase PGAM5, mitochondrial n=1 Tax=Cladocopium goreaui TaxID=2562237 RepID=A0A9P1BTS0_9DINO|nr:unnamed protein product [Cladocopium goreaui]